MWGITYLILSFAAGWEITGKLYNHEKRSRYYPKAREALQERKENFIWVRAIASFGIGVLLLSWALYLIAWLFHVRMGTAQPLFQGNLLVQLGTLLILSLIYGRRLLRKQKLVPAVDLIQDRKLFKKETVLYGILLLLSFALMFYIFFIQGGSLYAGFTVFSDYSPHTAMIRSFSRSANYPTQYPHFGGEDIKYHFMFQFLSGNLEYLGLPLDWAYNLPSALSLGGLMILLGQMAMRFGGRFGSQILSALVFLCPGGTAFFRFVHEHAAAGDLWETLRSASSFIGYTQNEGWGLWALNVYANQRHLAFGLLVVGSVIWLFWDWLEEGTAPDTALQSGERSSGQWFLSRLMTRKAWVSIRPEAAIFAGVIIGLCSFWNGAAVIGGLLILFGFAIFSDGKLDFLMMAVFSVLLAQLQSRFFVWGSIVSPSYYFGLLSEDKSIPGVLLFLLEISGISVFGLIVAAFFMKRKARCILFSFMLPLIFAFFVSLTPDIAVNHKYVMITWAFSAALWGDILASLFAGEWWKKAAALVLTICLTATGFYQNVIMIRGNGPGRRAVVDLASPLTAWLSENLTEKDLLLGPEYSMSETTLSGCMMYLGWPYYAWSAGYDTYARSDVAKAIFSSSDPEEVFSLIMDEGIDYILFENNMTLEDITCREDVIRDLFPLVYEYEKGGIRIYAIYNQAES